MPTAMAWAQDLLSASGVCAHIRSSFHATPRRVQQPRCGWTSSTHLAYQVHRRSREEAAADHGPNCNTSPPLCAPCPHRPRLDIQHALFALLDAFRDTFRGGGCLRSASRRCPHKLPTTQLQPANCRDTGHSALTAPWSAAPHPGSMDRPKPPTDEAPVCTAPVWTAQQGNNPPGRTQYGWRHDRLCAPHREKIWQPQGVTSGPYLRPRESMTGAAGEHWSLNATSRRGFRTAPTRCCCSPLPSLSNFMLLPRGGYWIRLADARQ